MAKENATTAVPTTPQAGSLADAFKKYAPWVIVAVIAYKIAGKR